MVDSPFSYLFRNNKTIVVFMKVKNFVTNRIRRNFEQKIVSG